jgi:Zn-dependent metalloprotease
MAAPGTAHVGPDRRPWHMRDCAVDTVDDHGGVHINSGILDREAVAAELCAADHQVRIEHRTTKA